MGYRLWGRREEEGEEGRDILRALTLVAGWRAVHSRDGDGDDSDKDMCAWEVYSSSDTYLRLK